MFRLPAFLNLQSGNSSVWRTASIIHSGDPSGRAADSRIGRRQSCASTRTMPLDSEAFHGVTIWQLPDTQAFFFVSGMTIDADGAANAYNADDTGLDNLSNAGEPGHWNGVITGRDGRPLVQQKSDPFPGYYISCTSLSDDAKKFTDPTSYVDASKIPYVALPQSLANLKGVRLGDFALVINLRNGKSTFALYADIGTLGEGSIALARLLGIPSDARHGGESDGILYLLFPGSGNQKPYTTTEIQNEGKKLLHNWKGIERLSSCAESDQSCCHNKECWHCFGKGELTLSTHFYFATRGHHNSAKRN